MHKKIAILTYHTIEPENSTRMSEWERFYNVTPEKFKKQMCYLKTNGYKALSMNEFIECESKSELPDKCVILTFDDGHISHYDTALPILKEFGLKGAFFLIVNEIGMQHRLNWDEARIIRDMGMDIGSHGMNHKILNKCSYMNLISELKSSKLMLQENLEQEILAFSIPRGLYSKRISHVARGVGYILVFTSLSGTTRVDSDPYCLKRFVMLKHYSMKEFISIVQKDRVFKIKKQIEYLVKNGIQKTVGIKKYDKIKQVIFSKV